MKNFIKLKIIVGLLFYSTVIFSVESKNVITVISPMLSSLLENDDSGKYQLLLSKISEEINIPIKVVIYPSVRAKVAFKNNPNACGLPSLHVQGNIKDLIYAKDYISMAKALVFSKKDYIANKEQLKNLKFSYVRGTIIPADLRNYAHSYPVNSEKENYNMLINDRVDAIISWVPDILGIDAEFLKKYRYSPSYVVAYSPDALACKDTKENRNFLKVFDKILAQMKSSGELKKILENSYIER